MARIRTVKPEFQNSQSIGRVSRDARLTFIELWPQCDDAGRIQANPRMLSSVLFPYDEDAPGLIEGWMAELEREGCIVRYRAGSSDYLQVCSWEHQKIDHPKPSTLPPPPAKKGKKTRLIPREQSATVRDGTAKARAIPNRTGPDQTVPVSSAGACAPFDEFWKVYPRREAKGAAEKAFAKAGELADAGVIIAAASAYASKRAGQDAKFTKLPATWLNARCWEDDGIAPCSLPVAADEAVARAMWNDRAAPLVDEIGAMQFATWLADAQFEAGPPVRITVPSVMKRNWVKDRFGVALERLYGPCEVLLAAPSLTLASKMPPDQKSESPTAVPGLSGIGQRPAANDSVRASHGR